MRALSMWKRSAVALGVGQGGAGRLLHHVAELSGQDQTLAGHHAGFHEQDVAADRGVEHAGGHAHHVLAVLGLGDVARLAQVAVQLLVGHLDALDLAGGDPAGHLAGHRADLALQVAHARLPGVVADQLFQRRVGKRDLVGLQAVLRELTGHQVALGDLQLFLLDVAGEVDDLHAVHQRRRNLLGVVGGGDEHHFAEVEGHAQVVVGEVLVLGGVEHFQQRRRGVPLVELPSLSTSSSRITGFLVPAVRMP